MYELSLALEDMHAHRARVEAVATAAAGLVAEYGVFMADTNDPTARELLASYAPPEKRLACDEIGPFMIVGLRREDLVRLARCPEHGSPLPLLRVAAWAADLDQDEHPLLVVSRGTFCHVAINTVRANQARSRTVN